MLLNIAIAALMVVVTTAIHAGGMVLALSAIRSQKSQLRWRLKIYWTSGIVLLMFFVSLVEIWAWAGTYLLLNAIEGLDQALYFSTVTYTTLGYGDIVLDQRWHLLASFEAANGIIMFGWTTAIVVAAVQQVYRRKDDG
jgi:hypothetical protein